MLKMQQTIFFADKTQRLTDYLSILGVIIGAGAIFLGWVAVRAVRLNALSRRRGGNGIRPRLDPGGGGSQIAPRNCGRPTRR